MFNNGIRKQLQYTEASKKHVSCYWMHLNSCEVRDCAEEINKC